MPITVIESEWRETPMRCKRCGGKMYSDGWQLPECPNDLEVAELSDILEWLITDHSDTSDNAKQD